MERAKVVREVSKKNSIKFPLAFCPHWAVAFAMCALWVGVCNETISCAHLSDPDIPREQVHHLDLSYSWPQASEGGGDTVAYQYSHLQGQLGALNVRIWWTASFPHLSQATRDFELQSCLPSIPLFPSTRYLSELNQSLWNNSSSTITILRLLPLK